MHRGLSIVLESCIVSSPLPRIQISPLKCIHFIQMANTILSIDYSILKTLKILSEYLLSPSPLACIYCTQVKIGFVLQVIAIFIHEIGGYVCFHFCRCMYIFFVFFIICNIVKCTCTVAVCMRKFILIFVIYANILFPLFCKKKNH